MQHGQKQAINANRKQASEAEQEQQQRESPTSYKSEIRISKFETNSNFKFLNSKWTAPRQVHLNFGFWICSGFRYSDFDFVFTSSSLSSYRGRSWQRQFRPAVGFFELSAGMHCHAGRHGNLQQVNAAAENDEAHERYRWRFKDLRVVPYPHLLRPILGGLYRFEALPRRRQHLPTFVERDQAEQHEHPTRNFPPPERDLHVLLPLSRPHLRRTQASQRLLRRCSPRVSTQSESCAIMPASAADKRYIRRIFRKPVSRMPAPPTTQISAKTRQWGRSIPSRTSPSVVSHFSDAVRIHHTTCPPSTSSGTVQVNGSNSRWSNVASGRA